MSNTASPGAHCVTGPVSTSFRITGHNTECISVVHYGSLYGMHYVSLYLTRYITRCITVPFRCLPLTVRPFHYVTTQGAHSRSSLDCPDAAAACSDVVVTVRVLLSCPGSTSLLPSPKFHSETTARREREGCKIFSFPCERSIKRVRSCSTNRALPHCLFSSL